MTVRPTEVRHFAFAHTRRLIGEGPSVPHGGIARCNKGGNLPYHFGLSQQGCMTLIRHDNDFKLVAPSQHFIQSRPGQHI